MNNKMYITLVGFNNYHGLKPFKLNQTLKLVKDPENKYDSEAIKVKMRYAGDVAYVANSVKTVIKGTMSAGRIIDKISDDAYCEVKFICNDGIIAKILSNKKIKKLKKDKENDINFLTDD